MITWTDNNRGVRGLYYEVVVRDARRDLVLRETTFNTRFETPAPITGKEYYITVEAISDCGNAISNTYTFYEGTKPQPPVLTCNYNSVRDAFVFSRNNAVNDPFPATNWDSMSIIRDSVRDFDGIEIDMTDYCDEFRRGFDSSETSCTIPVRLLKEDPLFL